MSATGEARPLLENVLLFGRLLRRAGLPVSLDQTLSFARSLAWVDVGDRRQVFYAARSLLVCRHRDLLLFEELFRRFWAAEGKVSGRRRKPPTPRRRRERRQRIAAVSLAAWPPRPADPEITLGDRAATHSREEVLQRRDFSQLAPEELEEVRRLIQEGRWRLSRRRTRRRVPDSRGEAVHLRRALRQAARQGGAVFSLPRQSRKVKQRPLVVLADVSGSMDKYSRLILQLLYSVAQSLEGVECFAFGTRLTRITHQIRLRNVDRALDEAAREIQDWAGGTRIGDCLGAFNRRWGRRVLRRGAVVLIISDGWERGDVSTLRQEMRHLAHRCHRLIWLNPHLGHGGYLPLVEGMAAALPFVDDFLPVHNLRSLKALADRLAALPQRRTRLPSRPSL